MTAQRQLKSDSRKVMDHYDAMTLDALLEKINDEKESILELEGASNLTVEIERESGDNYGVIALSYLVIHFLRMETQAEADEREVEQKRRDFIIQRSLREQKREELRELFLNGMISANVYEERMSKIPPG